MVTSIEAIFEHGVFRPTELVEIAEGERVQIVVSPAAPVETSSTASILAEIAALPDLQVAAGEGPDGEQQEDGRVGERPDDQCCRWRHGADERHLAACSAERQEQR
jgi:predicted DNA-binding antitoxin AbrB/MazE fold protein